jgi:hypothetical protein
MDQTPYTNFWKEEPNRQKHAWRPTDESRRRLQMFGFLQLLLLLGIAAVAIMIAKESKRTPPIYAQLPNGLVYETTRVAPDMNRLARTDLANDTLSLLYYQEGADNYLESLKSNVRMTILSSAANSMAPSRGKTATTVHLDIIESFETGSRFTPSRSWFQVMTKANLVKQEKKRTTGALVYLLTHWALEHDRYVLTGIVEAKPGEYYEAFLEEKKRLHSLPPEELERELNIRRNSDIPLPDQKPGKL